MGALEDAVLMHGPGAGPASGLEMTAALAAWRVDDWIGDAGVRHTLLEIAERLGLDHSPADEDEVLGDLLRRAIHQGTLRVFRVRASLSGGGGQLPPQPPGPGPAPPKQLVNPLITPASLIVVVAKTAKDPKTGVVAPYTHPKRQPVKLSTDAAFDGTGTFTCDKPALVKFWSAAKGGVEVKLDGKDNVWKPNAPPAWAKGASLGGGVTVFAEGLKPSGGLDDITVKLALTGGSKTNGPDDTSTITSVEVTLDIFKSRPAAGAEPPPFSQDDKVFVGRNILVQDAAHHFDRAQLVIQAVKPAAFKGELVLTAKDASVTAFHDEVFKAGEVTALPYTIATDKVPASGKLWAEGAGASKDMRDTGFVLGIKGVDDEGDRVTATAVQITLDICESRTKKGVAPKPLSANDKVKVGRFVHEQDANKHHGRAMLVVRKVKPDKFDGTLVVRSLGAKTELFDKEPASDPGAVKAVPLELDYTKVKNEDHELWVQGKTVSGALLDAGYFLHLKEDRQANADTILMTVCKFSHLKADIPSTPPVTVRANAAARHAFEVDGSAADHWDVDDAKNKALVLVEGSVLATDDAHKIQLSVQVAPAGVPVKWSAQRDKRPAPDGDHKDIWKLPMLSRPVRTAADPLKARMIADGVGTFHVRPFVDCNGSGDFDADADIEPYLLFNLVCIRIKGKSNTSVKGTKARVRPAAPTAATGCSVQSGGAAATAWVPANAAAYSKATVTITGGGKDGRRGLDRLFTGWAQNIGATATSASVPQGLDIFAQYQFQPPAPPAPPLPAAPPPPPPPVMHRAFFIFTQSGGGVHGPPPAAPPVPIACPVIDTSDQGAGGTGGDTATGQFDGTPRNGSYTPLSKANGNVVDKPIGQEWTVDTLDSPSVGLGAAHAGGLPGTMVAFRFGIDFRVDLVFWTNITGVPGVSGDPAERLYSSVQTNNWTVRFAINFNAVTGAPVGAVPGVTLTMAKDPSPTRLAAPVEGMGLDVRGPVALTVFAIDATA
jgi:hypothetical protein